MKTDGRRETADVTACGQQFVLWQLLQSVVQRERRFPAYRPVRRVRYRRLRPDSEGMCNTGGPSVLSATNSSLVFVTMLSAVLSTFDLLSALMLSCVSFLVSSFLFSVSLFLSSVSLFLSVSSSLSLSSADGNVSTRCNQRSSERLCVLMRLTAAIPLTATSTAVLDTSDVVSA